MYTVYMWPTLSKTDFAVRVVCVLQYGHPFMYRLKRLGEIRYSWPILHRCSNSAVI